LIERSQRPKIRSLPAAVAMTLVVVALGACGSSEGEEEETATTETSVAASAPTETAAAGGDSEAFCEAFAEATRVRTDATDAGESWAAYIADLETALAVAPDDVANDLEPYVEWGRTWSPVGDTVDAPPAGILDSFESVTDWTMENC